MKANFSPFKKDSPKAKNKTMYLETEIDSVNWTYLPQQIGILDKLKLKRLESKENFSLVGEEISEAKEPDTNPRLYLVKFAAK